MHLFANTDFYIFPLVSCHYPSYVMYFSVEFIFHLCSQASFPLVLSLSATVASYFLGTDLLVWFFIVNGVSKHLWVHVCAL